jgi:CRP/FNR family transcriptional regulator, nitrogen fixation regulation protein
MAVLRFPSHFDERSVMNIKIAAPAVSQAVQDPPLAGRREPTGSLERLATIRRYRRGQEIYNQQKADSYWYRMVGGVGRKCAVRADGRRQIVDLLLPGDWFGFTTSDQHYFTVESVVNSTVVACHARRRVEELADSNPEIAREIREKAFEAMTRLQQQILILGRSTASQRVGAFLLWMASRTSHGPDRLDLQISRYDIADCLALSSETVSRSLTGLRFRGAIEFASIRRLNIVDRGALEEDEYAA